MNQGLFDFPSGLLLGGGTLKVQEFLTSGVWKKPPGVENVYILAVGAGGGGGGSGYRLNANGISGSGGGGGAGDLKRGFIKVYSDLSITIGSGGNGGIGGASTGNSGATGGNGGSTTVNGLGFSLSVNGGYGGSGGAAANGNNANGGYGGNNGRNLSASHPTGTNSTAGRSLSLCSSDIISSSSGTLTTGDLSKPSPNTIDVVPFNLCLGGNGASSSGNGDNGSNGAITCGGNGASGRLSSDGAGSNGGNGGSGYCLIAWTE